MATRTVSQTADALRARNIYNDHNIAAAAKVSFIAVIYHGGFGKSWPTGYGLINQATPRNYRGEYDPAIRAPESVTRYNHRERKKYESEVKAKVGGEWERSPFTATTWFPKGTIAKLLGEVE